MSLLTKKKKNSANLIDSEKDEIEHAIAQGIQSFFAQQHEAIPQFVEQHFQYPGCWLTNRRAFGLDLIKAPINLIWAPFYAVIFVLLMLLGACGHKKAKRWASLVPTGMTTNVQQAINRDIRRSLLDSNTMKMHIVAQLKLLSESQNDDQQKQQQFLTHLQQVVDDALTQLMLTRTASADIANTIFSTALGAFAFNKFTPGGIGIGLMLAAYWVHKSATQDFIFGPIIGSWYYALFPPQASWLQQGVGVSIAMLVLAIIASFSGLVTDPVQSRLRLHHRRLHKLLRHTEKELLHNRSSQFKTLDPYIARILELFDALKVNL